MELDFKKLVAPYIDESVKSLEKFIEINSVYDENTKTKEKPFGDGVYKALDYIGNLGKKLGFNVDTCDNYCTELSVGNGNRLIDIYAHADVVPVSNTWKTDPFKLTIDGDKMIGRGTCDDKGPGMSALYAVKALIDNKKIDLNKNKIRIVFGGNEECGSACLEYYFNVLKKEYPSVGFTPDSDFPLIYAEKSVNTYVSEYDVNLVGFDEFDFGEATNIVLDKCSVHCYLDKELVTKEIAKYLAKYSDTGIQIKYDNYLISFIGKPSHGAVPWIGCNAGLHMINFIGQINKNKVLNNIYKNYVDGKGNAFKGNYSSKVFECSSYCIGLIKYANGCLKITVNMRLPENVEPSVAIKNVEKQTKPTRIKTLSEGKALLVDPDSFLVKTLAKVYVDHTNDTESKILAIGGGTYAKESKNTIAFGPTLPNRYFKIHEDDEYFLLSDYKLCMEIYADAIYRLAKGE